MEQGAGALNAERAGKRDEVDQLIRKVGYLVEAVAEAGCCAALQAALEARAAHHPG